MSAIEEFAEAVKASAELQEKMKAAGSDLAKIVAVAADAGFSITEADLQAHAESKKGEMSDEDLEKVAGGAVIVTYVTAVVA